ncbi:MAG: hypothetical protein JWQ32_2846 [Marmoricola sp.]|nr:hypothetical protein [Marmoricola sp.]
MTFIRVAHFPGGTREQYHAIDEALGDAVNNAPGRILLAAGGTSTGWNVVQIWETEDQLEAWVQLHLGAAFTKVGARGYPAPPEISDFTAEDLRIAP